MGNRLLISAYSGIVGGFSKMFKKNQRWSAGAFSPDEQIKKSVLIHRSIVWGN